jgi:hypothetical protein
MLRRGTRNLGLNDTIPLGLSRVKSFHLFHDEHFNRLAARHKFKAAG